MPHSTEAIFTNGEAFTDALLSGVMLQTYKAPILLVKGNSLPTEVANYVRNSEIKKKIIVGGENTVSNKVLKEIDEAIKNESTNL